MSHTIDQCRFPATCPKASEFGGGHGSRDAAVTRQHDDADRLVQSAQPLHNLQPVHTGQRRSTTARSGLECFVISSAWAPSEAATASQPRLAKARHRRVRKMSSSSTTSAFSEDVLRCEGKPRRPPGGNCRGDAHERRFVTSQRHSQQLETECGRANS
jgi:hypothetical protein